MHAMNYPINIVGPCRSGKVIKKTGWYIRRLISDWKRWAGRGSSPRNKAQKTLFEAAGIPWPERSLDQLIIQTYMHGNVLMRMLDLICIQVCAI